MYQLIKAIMMAGMFAAGWPFLTEAANAQATNTWYLINQQNLLSCNIGRAADVFVDAHIPGGSDHLPSINIPQDSPLANAIYQACTDGTGFWAYLDGTYQWTSFYTYPGLK